MSLPRSPTVLCTAPAKVRFLRGRRQLVEDRRAVVCQVATRTTVSAISTLLSTSVGRLRHLGPARFPVRVAFPSERLEFNPKAKKGILDPTAVRRHGQQAHGVGLVPPRENAQEQAGLAARANRGIPLACKPIRAC